MREAAETSADGIVSPKASPIVLALPGPAGNRSGNRIEDPLVATMRWRGPRADLRLSGHYNPVGAEYCLTEIVQIVISQPVRLLAVDITDLHTTPECLLTLLRLRLDLRKHGADLIFHRRPSADALAHAAPRPIASHRAG